jgi:hypothetical protein
MMKLNTKQKTALKLIRATRGRFFGLKTTQGETLNAQFLGETNDYITIFDRNARFNRRLAKTSLASVNSSN